MRLITPTASSHRTWACVFATSLLLFFSTAAHAQVPPGYVDASTFGYNAVDATLALQRAINTGSNVYVPNMGTDWIVTPIFLGNDNQTIFFEPGVVVAAKEGEFHRGSDSLFRADNRTNVRLEGYGATLRMRQSDYQQPDYSVSEFRMGIWLHEVNDFEILGLTIEDTGGDGIYLSGRPDGATFSENVFFKDVVIDNAYRNGISIESVKGLVIDNTVIVNTSGTAPQSGIDIEPFSTSMPVENIVIRDSVIMANASQGFMWEVIDHPDRPPVTGTLENVTVINNGSNGVGMNAGALPGWTVKDMLIVGNAGFGGFFVGGNANDPTHDIDYSAIWDNHIGGPIGGQARLGPGSVTDQEPIFVSTDINDPFFLYLDPSTPTAITQGASDGSYMGARPMFTGLMWNVDDAGLWEAAGNWAPNSIPNGNKALAVFGNAINSPRTVFTDTAVTVKDIVFYNANAYAIAGTGSVNLEADVGNATIDVDAGPHEFQSVVNLISATDVDVASGASLAFNNALNLGGKILTKTGAGTLTVNNSQSTGAGFLFATDGTVAGFGKIGGKLTNAGAVIAPGNGPGKLSVAGDYAQTSGSIQIEIDGTAADDVSGNRQYDLLDVTGDLTIVGGSLDIVLGFSPSPGDTFDVLNFATANVTGATLNLGSPGIHLAWDSSQLFVDGTLSAVSAPTPVAWRADISGDWNENSNWSPGLSPNGRDLTVVFGSAITAPRTVFTETAVTAKEIRFDNLNSYAIVGSGSVNLASNTNLAAINVLTGSHEFQAVVNLHNSTDVDVDADASLAFNNALNLNGSTMIKTGSGPMEINNVLDTDGGSIFVVGGVLGGSGKVVGDLVNTAGTIAPGNSPGKFTVTGNYLQTGGSLELEINGTSAADVSGGRQYDLLSVDGDLTIDGGSLDIVMGFTPAPGDTFDILDFQTIDISGATLNLGTPGANMAWDSSRLTADGSLTALSAMLGDMNGDLAVTEADAELFLQALLDPVTYDAHGFFVVSADFNDDVDGNSNFGLGDVAAFNALFGEDMIPHVPEPTSATLMVVALGIFTLLGDRRN